MSIGKAVQKKKDVTGVTNALQITPLLRSKMTESPRQCYIDTLPDTVLLEIFSTGYVMGEERPDEDIDGEDSNAIADPLFSGEQDPNLKPSRIEPNKILPFEVLASHICRRWRTIILSHPYYGLFCNLRIHPPLKNTKLTLNDRVTLALQFVSIGC